MKLDLEQWREVARPYYEVMSRVPPSKAAVNLDVVPAGQLMLTRISAPEQLLVHDPAIQKGVCHDYLLYEHFHVGGGKGEVGETGFVAHPARLHLIDMSKRYVSMMGKNSSRGVLIPHAAVGYVPGEDLEFSSLKLDSAAGRILSTAHEMLVSAASNGLEQDVSTLTGAFTDLISRLMLGRQPFGEAARTDDFSLKLHLYDHVAANLASPDLDVDHLSTVFRISRATVFRHFEAEGGVRRYIRNRRLDRCFFELAGSPPTRGQVKSVAERWHFRDATNFNRLFRERFGMSPTECFSARLSPVGGAPAHLTRMCQIWFDHLRSA